MGLLDLVMGKLPHRIPTTNRDEPELNEDHPPPEEDFGGGDIASPEPCPPTEDDCPLD